VDKRFLYTILLCMGIFFLWTAVVYPALWPKPKGTPSPAPTPAPPPPSAQPPPVVRPPEPVEEAGAVEPIVLQTRRYRAVFDNRGAVLRELDVLHENEWIPLLEPSSVRAPSFYIDGLGHNWKVPSTDVKNHTVRFVTSLRGLEYEKIFVLADPESDTGRHAFRVDLIVRNVSDQEQTAGVRMVAFNGIRRDSDYRYESYLYGFWGTQTSGPDIGFKGNSFSWADTHKQATQQAGRLAAGIQNRYFALILIPENPMNVHSYHAEGMGESELKESAGFKNIKLRLETSSIPLAKGGSPMLYTFHVYAGPIRDLELREAPRPIASLLDYTGPNFVASIILGVLNFFHNLIGGYGVAIVLTTLFVRVCLFWLNKNSQVSMFRMSQLSPKLEALKLKYANDPQRMSQEQWKLFREEKISPLSGCLPVLLQLPIFLAMYSVLDQSVDLRHQPFLWFNDLSQPDKLVDFGRKVFWELESINLLPILMTIVWFVQAKMAPKSKDPQMQMNQKMMQWMPVLFGVMCYNLAAGLSWYFLFNALFSMAEQRLIKKYFLAQPEPAKVGGA
jgi:YidC/Oxa1 family membrane protein insertase